MPFRLNPFSGQMDWVDPSTGVSSSSSGASTDNAIVRWDGVTGEVIQNSGVIVDDSNEITIPVGIAAGVTFGDGDSGLYEASDDVLIIETGNTTAITIDASQEITLANELDVTSGGTGVTALTDHAILVGSGVDPITPVGPGTDGELLIGNTGADPSWATLTAGGGGVTITNVGGSITINVTGGGLPWTEVTGIAVAAAVNNGYILNNAGLVTATLPAVAIVGDVVRITGKGAGGWRIAQNAGQTIHFGNQDTTAGAGGRLDSTDAQDTVELVCITANTNFNVLSSIGNITVT